MKSHWLHCLPTPFRPSTSRQVRDTAGTGQEALADGTYRCSGRAIRGRLCCGACIAVRVYVRVQYSIETLVSVDSISVSPPAGWYVLGYVMGRWNLLDCLKGSQDLCGED